MARFSALLVLIGTLLVGGCKARHEGVSSPPGPASERAPSAASAAPAAPPAEARWLRWPTWGFRLLHPEGLDESMARRADNNKFERRIFVTPDGRTKLAVHVWSQQVCEESALIRSTDNWERGVANRNGGHRLSRRHDWKGTGGDVDVQMEATGADGPIYLRARLSMRPAGPVQECVLVTVSVISDRKDALPDVIKNLT